jgi:hypothetical protein
MNIAERVRSPALHGAVRYVRADPGSPAEASKTTKQIETTPTPVIMDMQPTREEEPGNGLSRAN